MDEVVITARPPDMFAKVLDDDRAEAFVSALASARHQLDGRTVWHINSTSAGGGVAEMLQSVLSYPRGAEIDVRWLVVEGNEPFFEVTKRIHNLLHGSVGDGGPLGDAEREVYESALRPEIEAVLNRLKPDDIVILHDPQTLGLASALSSAGARVIWACHVGADEPNEQTRMAWNFLHPYVAHTEAQCFSRPQYRWEGLDEGRVSVIPPCIDVFAPKNQFLIPEQVEAILDVAGIVPSASTTKPPGFLLLDGNEAEVRRKATMFETVSIPENAPIICQISRWDPLKDHQGIMEAFAQRVPRALGAHLVLAGPDPNAVADDPEGKATLNELIEAWQGLDDEARSQVHLCCVPMDDLEENAAIINALQRRSDVIVQKSLAEGFGLTVAEAMWKGRPTVGSRVGGIQDQITADDSGLLVDPVDPADLARSLIELLQDRDEAERLGEAAHQRVLDDYLAPTYLMRQFGLVDEVLARPAA
jgi:trehalose synthase